MAKIREKMLEVNFEDLEKRKKIEVYALMNSCGASGSGAPAHFRIRLIFRTLLRLEEGVEYDIREVFCRNWYEDRIFEVLAYLDDIYDIKELGRDTTIDLYHPEEEDNIKKVIKYNIPHFDFDIDKETIVVKNSPFYRSLNDADKVLFYLQDPRDVLKTPEERYHNVFLPERFRTDEFYTLAKGKFYFFMASRTYFSVTFHGCERMFEIIGKIRDLSWGKEFLEEKLNQNRSGIRILKDSLKRFIRKDLDTN
ncbi:MAG: hypothetical protein ACOC5T_06935 [Elusimicrobiota bacterium]